MAVATVTRVRVGRLEDVCGGIPFFTAPPACPDSMPAVVLPFARDLSRDSIADETDAVEVSVVMPCLNEADTVEQCIRKAQQAFAEHGIAGEVIIADNGSTDDSRDIARRMGARVAHVEARGYGNALMGGISIARGRYIIMGDADDSYDFLQIPKFVARLREGYDLVQGCRLSSGGGHVMPGAMPAGLSIMLK